MKKLFLSIAILAASLTLPLRAQDISGEWHGTLETAKLRVALRIAKDDKGALSATLYSVDQAGSDGIPIRDFTLTGSGIQFTIPQIQGRYTGTLSSDRSTISGTFTQGTPQPLSFTRVAAADTWLMDSSPHTVSFIHVQPDIQLEVLDWGGTGRQLILLAGLGNSAHVFDTFAPKLTPKYHVYGITRRGFGASSSPAPIVANYTADRLGDDVLAVIAALKINKPVVAGHSIAGEELSSIGTRHPEQLSGLIYLDATFPYAFYDPAHGNLVVDSLELHKQLDQLLPGNGPQDTRRLIEQILAILPLVQKELEEQQKQLAAMPPPPSQANQQPMPPSASTAILSGQQKYTHIPGPILAISAVPHNLNGMARDDPKARAAAEASDLARTTAIADAFEKKEPQARVVRLANADHYVFKSNEADVLREMNIFLDHLPPL